MEVNKLAIDRKIPKEERIMVAAEQVFSQKGYTQATLDEIIKIADTGKGTVYKYYKNKENLFYSLVMRKNEPFLLKLQGIEKQDICLEKKLLSYFTELVSFMHENAVIWQVLLFEMRGCSSGWQLVPQDEDRNTFKVKVTWGEPPKAEEVEIVKRYHQVIHSKIEVLLHVLEGAVKNGELKPLKDLHAWTASIFFGVIMSVFHNTKLNETETAEDVASFVTDWLMHGVMVHKESIKEK